MASKVREEVSSAFNPEALADDFESIEFFMDTFPEDARIKEASIDLVASILKAIEDAIGFFTSGQGELAFPSRRRDMLLIPGKGHGPGLLSRREMITRRSCWTV
jgi:hypothetical protein